MVPYPILVEQCPTHLKRDEVQELFGGIQGVEEFQRGMMGEKKLAQFTDREFDVLTDIEIPG